MKRLIIIISCFFVVIVNSFCQNLLKQNIYYDDMNYYNPAASFYDTSRQYYASFYTKYKFLNSPVYAEKPYDFSVSFQGRTQNTSGHYTAGYLYDGYSFFDRHSLYGGYGYKWDFGGHRLSIGARATLNFDAICWDKFSGAHYIGQQLFVMPDIDLGLYYQWKGLNLGISAKNLLAIGERVDGNVLLRSRRTLFTNLSYDLYLSEIMLAPHLLLSYDGEIGLDIGIFGRLFEYGKVSYIFRVKELRHVILLGGDIPCGLTLDIAFDFSNAARDKHLDVRIGYKF